MMTATYGRSGVDLGGSWLGLTGPWCGDGPALLLWLFDLCRPQPDNFHDIACLCLRLLSCSAFNLDGKVALRGGTGACGCPHSITELYTRTPSLLPNPQAGSALSRVALFHPACTSNASCSYAASWLVYLCLAHAVPPASNMSTAKATQQKACSKSLAARYACPLQ